MFFAKNKWRKAAEIWWGKKILNFFIQWKNVDRNSMSYILNGRLIIWVAALNGTTVSLNGSNSCFQDSQSET